MPAKKCLIGLTFGKLKVISQAESVFDNRGFPRLRYTCKCECGKEITTLGQNLRGGFTNSCGCLHAERMHELHFVHGRTVSNDLTYSSWASMKSRCYDTKKDCYPDYGGRGITVCQKWRDSFADFLADMGERPKGKTLHRIKNEGNYEPGNCEWATPRVQMRHTRRNVMLTIDGITACATDHAKRAGLHRSVVYARIAYGWDEKDLLKPSTRKNPSNPWKDCPGIDNQ